MRVEIIYRKMLNQLNWSKKKSNQIKCFAFCLLVSNSLILVNTEACLELKLC